jgi:DNA invertase Pin-like site-specific DNA recombinase
MLIGYAWVSTAEQTLELQTDALTAAGCEKLFTDVAGGARTERPGLDQAIEGSVLILLGYNFKEAGD